MADSQCVFFVNKKIVYFQRSDEPEENDELVKSREEESVNGKDKRAKNVNGRTDGQPSKKRKEDSSPEIDVKKPSPGKKKVNKLFQDWSPLM